MIELFAYVIVGLIALFFALIAFTGIAMAAFVVLGIPLAALVRLFRK